MHNCMATQIFNTIIKSTNGNHFVGLITGVVEVQTATSMSMSAKQRRWLWTAGSDSKTGLHHSQWNLSGESQQHQIPGINELELHILKSTETNVCFGYIEIISYLKSSNEALALTLFMVLNISRHLLCAESFTSFLGQMYMCVHFSLWLPTSVCQQSYTNSSSHSNQLETGRFFSLVCKAAFSLLSRN